MSKCTLCEMDKPTICPWCQKAPLKDTIKGMLLLTAVYAITFFLVYHGITK